RRRLAGAAREAAEEFGKTVEVEEEARIQQRGEDAGSLFVEAVSGEPRRDEGVVVRPDRTIVVRHRVVARLAGGHGPNSPARGQGFAGQCRGEPDRPARLHDSGKETVSGIRGPDPAWALVPVEGDRIGREILAPERLLELVFQ